MGIMIIITHFQTPDVKKLSEVWELGAEPVVSFCQEWMRPLQGDPRSRFKSKIQTLKSVMCWYILLRLYFTQNIFWIAIDRTLVSHTYSKDIAKSIKNDHFVVKISWSKRRHLDIWFWKCCTAQSLDFNWKLYLDTLKHHPRGSHANILI